MDVRAHLEDFLSEICAKATLPVIDGSLFNEIGPLVDDDTFAAPSAEQLLIDAFDPERRDLLDFGCGGSHHRAFLESIGYAWRGVDYLEGVAGSVRGGVALQNDVVFYDGRSLPFEDESFDVVCSMLVFNCLQHADDNYAEIARVLRPGGLVIGQTGSLEAMTDYIVANPTPYGLKTAAQNAGLALTRLYPKHDVFSFLSRQLYITMTRDDGTPFTPMLNPSGFFYAKLEERCAALGLSVREINLLKLQFSAHLCFVMQKPV